MKISRRTLPPKVKNSKRSKTGKKRYQCVPYPQKPIFEKKIEPSSTRLGHSIKIPPFGPAGPPRTRSGTVSPAAGNRKLDGVRAQRSFFLNFLPQTTSFRVLRDPEKKLGPKRSQQQSLKGFSFWPAVTWRGPGRGPNGSKTAQAQNDLKHNFSRK